MGRQLDCPGCGVEIDAGMDACIHCGTDLSTVVVKGSGEHCPDCGTGVSATDSFCPHCGGTLSDRPADAEPSYEGSVAALESDTDDSATVPDSLVLAFAGHKITITDGDTVGQKIRAGLSRAGRPDSEVLRIHREHVRFFKESDGFYVRSLGDNPTHLNGSPLNKGDLRAVSPGDNLVLSGVATITIRSPGAAEPSSEQQRSD